MAIAARFDLALSANLCFTPIAPRRVQEQLGRLLMEVEQRPAAVGHRGRPGGAAGAVPRGVHGAGIPDDLRSGYGYPQLTHADTKRILGGNVARTMGVDVPIAPAAETAATDPVPLEGGVG